jgi:hypothetical protein
MARVEQTIHPTRIETPPALGEFFVVWRYAECNQQCKEFIMRSKFDGLMWGLIFIVAGGLFMAHNLGYEINLTPVFWMGVCAVLSAAWFIRYLFSDHQRWGWLLPACQFAAIAVMIALSEANVRDTLVAAPLFIGFTIPFVVAFFTDRQQNYWAIIPAAIFAMLTVTTLIGEQAGEFFAALVVLTIAAPFFFVYVTQPKQWWALIPAGILGSIGVTGLSGAIIPAFDDSVLRGTIFFLGFAATFGVLYLRRNTIPTEWTRVPALVFSGLALLTLAGGLGVNGVPLVFIAVGIIVLWTTLRPQRAIVS